MIKNTVNRIITPYLSNYRTVQFCYQCCHRQYAILQTNFINQNKSFNPEYSPFSLTSKRYYSIGDYDKLWQAVSSGRGKGRSGKKKARPKLVDGEFLKFGVANMKFPGLNEQIQHKAPRETANLDKLRESSSDFQRKRKTFRIDPTQRGWAGTTWPGRHAGAPVLPNGDTAEDFDCIVLEVKKVSITRANGKRKRTSALVVVGNKKGSIGWAIGKASIASAAIKKARNKAVNYLHHVPVCEGATIYHNLRTKHRSTEITFERKVPGYGRRCQRIIRAVTELAGIDNIRCKITGSTNPLGIIRATFQGLQMQETHQSLAERTGKNVVEFRKERGNRPVVVATPSNAAVKLRILEEKQSKGEEDITKCFDPFRGAHRPKSIKQIQGDYSQILRDV